MEVIYDSLGVLKAEALSSTTPKIQYQKHPIALDQCEKTKQKADLLDAVFSALATLPMVLSQPP